MRCVDRLVQCVKGGGGSRLSLVQQYVQSRCGSCISLLVAVSYCYCYCYSLSVYFWSCCSWIMLHIFRQHDIRATQLDALVCWLSWTILDCTPLQLHGCCLEVLKGLGRFLSLWQTSSVCVDGRVQRWRYYATVHLFRDLAMSCIPFLIDAVLQYAGGNTCLWSIILVKMNVTNLCRRKYDVLGEPKTAKRPDMICSNGSPNMGFQSFQQSVVIKEFNYLRPLLES